MNDGHWYLSDGMILLYEEAISKEANLASALITHGRKIRMLNADTPKGYVELERKTKAEPDGAANRSQPIRAETNRTSVAAGSDR